MESQQFVFTVIRKYGRGIEKNPLLGQEKAYSYLNMTQQIVRP